MMVRCSVKDYRVTIGKGNCTDLDLSPNSLVCNPPRSEPERLYLPADPDGHFVYVSCITCTSSSYTCRSAITSVTFIAHL